MSLNKISINNKEIIGVDDEPFAESDNLIKSKGVFENTPSLKLDNSSSLLNIGDEQGNVILEFNNGHLKTKEFNSNDALITQYDNSSSLLNIGDEQGNVILEFNNGHLKTKEFNSNDALITQYDNSSNELNVGDINGEVIAKFVNGHIKTKNFDSETIGGKIAYHSDWRRFKIKTNISPYGIYNNSQGETSTIEPDNLSLNFVDVTSVIALPSTYTNTGTPTRLIMLFMGGHSYLNDTMWYPADPFVTEELIPYFLNRGYAVASSNGMKDLTYQEYLNLPNSGFTSPMGLPDIIESFHKTYLYIKSNYNIEDKVYLFGGSLGGVGVLNYTKMHPNNIAAVACMAPMVDLKNQMWVNTGTRGKQRQIQILGFTNNTYDENKANPWNPMARIKTIDGIDYYDISVPIKMTYGTADEVLPDNQYFKRLAQAMINAKATVYCKWYTGFDHMDVAFANEDVVKKDTIDFFDRF